MSKFVHFLFDRRQDDEKYYEIEGKYCIRKQYARNETKNGRGDIQEIKDLLLKIAREK